MSDKEMTEVVVLDAPRRAGAKMIALAVIAIVMAGSVAGYALFAMDDGGPGGGSDDNDGLEEDNNEDNEADDTTPIDDNPPAVDENWLANYTPEYAEGSGVDDWWIDYPDQLTKAGDPVSHPSWVLDPLDTKPVVLLVHTNTGCEGCVEQEADMEEALADYGDGITYIDLTTATDSDKTYEAFDIYYPHDSIKNYPLTVFVTLIKDGEGNVSVAWHSDEGATGDEWIRDYMRDSIFYHDENLGEWSG